jgi:glycerol kinase
MVCNAAVVALLAIDQGTSATKAVVLEGSTVLGIAEVGVTVSATVDGAVELDPGQMWTSVVDAVEAALAQAGRPRIEAIGLANQGETVMAWDRASGRATGPAVVWQDRRSVEVCQRLERHAPRLAHLTGLELDPYFVAPKIVWLRDRIGDGAVITTTDTWLLHRMCGEFATDVATAGRSLLLDLDTTEWSDEACALFGLSVADLPRVVGNAEPIGECTAFGWSAPVTGACVDQQAALFAESCHEAGEAKCTYGTGAFLLASTGRSPVRSAAGLVGCPAWRIGDATTWCLDGQVYTVGAAVTWLMAMRIIDDPTDLDRLGGSVPDSGGVTFVPALAGLAAPYWRPEARAAFTGLSLGTERAHLVRAAVEGIAAQVALLGHAVASDLGAPMTRLRVDGGLTRSSLLLQLQADLSQVPLEVYPSPHATAFGAAAFAELGLHPTVPGSARPEALAWQPERTVSPQIGPDEAADRLHRWRVVADATMSL